MADEHDRTDELLRRARRIEKDADQEVAASETRAARNRTEGLRHGLEDVAWLASGIRRARRFMGEGRKVLTQMGRYTGPFATVAAALWRTFAFVAHRASHIRVAENEFDFSPKKTARSLLICLAIPCAAYIVYNLSTRHEGVFLINDKHLVSEESDEYQMGGCWRKTPTHSSCEKGEGVIVLIRPAWIPSTGIFSATYDEDVGVVPLQGKCELETYGIYLRMPWMPFLRGALKPIAIGVGQCDGIANANS